MSCEQQCQRAFPMSPSVSGAGLVSTKCLVTDDVTDTSPHLGPAASACKSPTKTLP